MADEHSIIPETAFDDSTLLGKVLNWWHVAHMVIVTVIVATGYGLYGNVRDTVICAVTPNKIYILELNERFVYPAPDEDDFWHDPKVFTGRRWEQFRALERQLQHDPPSPIQPPEVTSLEEYGMHAPYYHRCHTFAEAEDWLIENGYKKRMIRHYHILEKTGYSGRDYKHNIEGSCYKTFAVKALAHPTHADWPEKPPHRRNWYVESVALIVVDYGDGEAYMYPFRVADHESPIDWDRFEAANWMGNDYEIKHNIYWLSTDNRHVGMINKFFAFFWEGIVGMRENCHQRKPVGYSRSPN